MHDRRKWRIEMWRVVSRDCGRAAAIVSLVAELPVERPTLIRAIANSPRTGMAAILDQLHDRKRLMGRIAWSEHEPPTVLSVDQDDFGQNLEQYEKHRILLRIAADLAPLGANGVSQQIIPAAWLAGLGCTPDFLLASQERSVTADSQ